ncbi:glutaredoxin family protein [Micromonospora fulviviridis]|uniref:glutaredoxin family protein n=1 Tax=Micromonospora fulviviridis TaxID=47860 RepID=UPI0037965E93
MTRPTSADWQAMCRNIETNTGEGYVLVHGRQLAGPPPEGDPARPVDGIASCPGDEEADLTVNDLPHHDELVVYGAGWCPDVRRSRALLDAARVPYLYVDVDEDQAATELVRRLQQGQRRIPTLVWPDGSFLVEPTDDQLQAHLTRNREAGGRAGRSAR